MEKIFNEKATCPALIVRKILDQYEKASPDITKGLFQIAAKMDISNPNTQVPLNHLNELIGWIEKNLGPANLKMIGNILGETAFENLMAKKALPVKVSPKEAIEKLILVLQAIIQDPFNRYLKVVEIQDKSARVRKTQTFNNTVEIAIIESFIRKAGVNFPRTRLIRDYQKGPEYDEYEITWF